MGKEHEKARSRLAAAQTIQEGESIKEDIRKGEAIYGQVQSLLGAPGTYPGSPGYQPPTGPTTTTTGGGLLEDTGVVSKAAIGQIKGKNRKSATPLLSEMAKGVDVGKAVSQVAGSTQFQIASQLTAEAQQLINREGPLYERMKAAMQNPILSRGSQALEDSLDQINQSFARGGRARREGLRDAMKMQAQMEANEQIASAMTQANYQMDAWSRDNARAQLQFNQAWGSNLAGVRQVYLQNMSAARGFMAGGAIPASMQYQKQADAINQAGKKNWAQIGLGAVMAVVGTIGAFYTGGATLGVAAQGVGMMAGGASGSAAKNVDVSGFGFGGLGGGGQTTSGGGIGTVTGTATKAG